MTPRTWVPAVAAVAVAGVGAVLLLWAPDHSTAAAHTAAANTEKVQRGALSALVSGTGTLTYRARPDGSPYVVIDQARGVYTHLPQAGDEVRCGGELYRVDNRPVLLLCGAVPAYRALSLRDRGPDVRQLNRNLHRLGYDADARVHVDPRGAAFTSNTEQALRSMQRDKGDRVSGRLAPGEAVFLPEAVRVAKVTGQIGGPARPGDPVLTATSDELYVRVDLDASQQGAVRKGDHARVTLPGNTPVDGRVTGFGRVAQAQQGSQAADATIPTFLALGDPAKAAGLDQAPVEVDITTKGVENALSVPVTALVGRSGGGFAVEIVHAGGQRALVPVRLGLFDTGAGRVQVQGNVREGDSVAVPSI